MSNDDLDHIPSIVPSREEGVQRSTRNVPAERRRNSKGQAQTPSASNSGTLSRLIAGVALIAGGLAFGWAWQLQGQLDQATGELQDYAARITDLESRLSDTDEGMNQSAAVQAVKIAELESEVRKLWDNVWKKTRAQLDKLEADSAGQGKSLKELGAAMASTEAQLEEISAEIATLKSVGGDLERLMSSAKASQAEVERLADSLNRIELSLAKLDKRVAGNEEWVGSVDAFRRQMNASLSELEAKLQVLQASP